jgi:mono/diheme cytochrome c family protein
MKWFLSIVLLEAICLSASAQKSFSPAQAKLAAEAHQILVTHCGKCHGKGGSYSDEMLLDYPKLVGGDEPVIVKEKVGDSFLYETIADGDMPPKKAKNPVPAEKMAILKKWIEAGAPDWNLAPKPKREIITNEEISKRVLEDLKKQPGRNRRFIRYYTLTHLYNVGESDDAMENYRLALVKLVNSLSWEKEITKPVPIDPEKTILRIDLRDFDWDLSIWAKIIAQYQYVPRDKNMPFKQVCELTRAKVPFIRADWFISKAALPPLYHEILDLPKTDKELEDRLEVNVARNLRDSPGRRVWRSGFLESGISKFNRIVERHKFRAGAYWKSYDFDSNKGRKNIFENPLTFQHAGGEIIWNLPNGLQAYLLVDSTGKRLDEAPVSIVFTTQGNDPVIRNGLSCMACHTSGMKEFKDRVGELHLVIQKTPYDDADEKDYALALYPEAKAINALVEKDKKTFEKAVLELGGVLGGREPIELLAERFDEPLEPKMAAAEMGLDEATFIAKLKESDSNPKVLNTLLAGGTIAREAWEENFSAIFAIPGTVLWEFETGDWVRSSPAIGSDGTVYVGSVDNKLYAIKTDSKGLAKSPWPMRGQNPLHTGRVMKMKE